MNSSKIKIDTRKGLLKLALVIVLILIQGILFYITWINEYNILLRLPYIFKGNLFLTIMYMILLYIFMIVFDCNNLPELKPSSIILSESLSIIFCNMTIYLIAIMPAAATGFLPIAPLGLLTIDNIIVIIIWVIFVYLLFKKMFPISKLLLITNDNSVDDILYKFSRRVDLYEISDKIVARNDNLDEVFEKCKEYDNVLIGDLVSELRNDIVKSCFNCSKNIFVIPKISDILIKYSKELFLLDTPIYLSTNFGLSLESKFFKRLLDIIFSLIILIVFFPLWLIFAILIKIEDGGPIFYFQERITINMKKFNIIKFRSMKITDDDKVVPTGLIDNRITKIGGFIRKFHIDEVPQFINVLCGDMSVVGPRPERVEHVDLYSKEISEFTYRYKVKSGITGLAQIYGKYNTSAIDKLKLDLIYIKKYSIVFDLELILRTIKAIFSKDNTEGFGEKQQEYIMNNAK